MQHSPRSGNYSSASVRRLWAQLFADPSEWWDYRKVKTIAQDPDFKHKVSQEPLWVDCPENPGWVKEMLEKTKVHPATQKVSVIEGKRRGEPKYTIICAYGCNILSFEDALDSLEDGSLAQPSVEDLVRLVCMCTQEKHVGSAIRFHAYLENSGLDAHKALGNYVVSMLAEAKSMSNAQKVFDALVSQSECSWNALINGYIRCGDSKRAFFIYKEMLQESRHHVSGYTFVALLKACIKLKDVESGREIHAGIVKERLLKSNPIVSNTLIDMYAKCGSLVDAQEVFDLLPVWSVITWTVLIAGYAQNEHGHEALACFEQMRCHGVIPNTVTYACVLKACGTIKAAERGREIHADVEGNAVLKANQYVGNALVDMYAKCGKLAMAKSVFDKLPARDVVSWNALIAGYVEHEQSEEALACYKQMRLAGVTPSPITFTCTAKACGIMGAIDRGEEIREDIESKGLLAKDVVLGSTLVDMYVKCGRPYKAEEVFDQLPAQDLATWTSLIMGYAQQGETEKVLYHFDQIRESGTKPDPVTFLVVLNACSHAGLVDKAQAYYEAMCEDHEITPTLEHYACICDLLSRAGQLEWAVTMMKRTPFQPTMVMWLTVLTACRKRGNVQLGREVFEEVLRLDEKDSTAYVCMGNIYVDAGMHDDAARLEAQRRRKCGSK